MRRKTAKRRGQATLFFVLCALPLLFVFPYLGGVNNPNENVRTYMTMALVEEQTFRIDDMVTRFGWVNDMAKVPQPDGSARFFSVKGPATSLAGVPAYWLFKRIQALRGRHFPTDATPMAERQAWLREVTWACRLFAVQLPCFLFVLWFERYLRAFTSDLSLRLSAVAAVALGTNYLAYTNMFASHAPFAIAAFCSFAMTERELRVSGGDSRARRPSKALLAGFFTGWTVLLEYHAFPAAVILALYGLRAFWRPSRLAAFALGGLPHVLIMMFFQWRAFGNPLTPGHKMVENARFAAEHHQGIFGVVVPSLDHINAISFDLGFGFFGTSPFMTLGLLAIPFVLLFPGGRGPARLRRHFRLATVVWVVSMMLLWSVHAGFLNWRGGWTVGPRYLGCAPPFFAFGAVLAFERLLRARWIPRSVVRGLAGGLALASICTIGTVGILYDTLPENVARPLAQFSIPLARTGFVPHHVGEWFGWTSTTFWYVVLVALLATAILTGLVFAAEHTGRATLMRVGTFALALGAGLYPAFSTPADNSPLFVLHPEARGLLPVWEPQGRDRITLLRNDAERYGPRRPCYWLRLADLDRVVGQDYQAARDEAKAHGTRREMCPKTYF